VKSNDRLGFFITFILLASVPKNRSVAVSDFLHIQPARPQLLPLTQLLGIALKRVREHERLGISQAAPAGLVFRFGTRRE
jgi:hypothetical protein